MAEVRIRKSLRLRRQEAEGPSHGHHREAQGASYRPRTEAARSSHLRCREGEDVPSAGRAPRRLRRAAEEASIASVGESLRPPFLAWYECNDVFQYIFFNFLGLSDVLQCRLVCKLWHRSLGSIDHIRRTLCCLTHDYPIDDVFWLRPELPDMHVCPRPVNTCPTTTTCWKNTLHLALPQRYARCVVAASAHGLLCLQLDDGQFMQQFTPSLVVCNPVSGSHKLLPKLTCIDGIESVGMHFNLVTKSYTILVTGTNKFSSKSILHENGDPVTKPFYVSHVEIYHSESGSWEYVSHFITDAGVRKGRIAWWNGQYHWIIQKPKNSLRLLAYDMTRKQWIDSSVTTLKNGLMPSLFVWGDWLLCKFCIKSGIGGSKYWKLEKSETLQASGEHSSRKMSWQPLHFVSEKHPLAESESRKKAKSLHIATHFPKFSDTLHVCIFNPYSFAPAETPITSPRSSIICRKRQAKESCFSFTPCHSAEA